jgi:hypothetical protein
VESRPGKVKMGILAMVVCNLIALREERSRQRFGRMKLFVNI